MYELICGSIFERKCDLMIIPCNNTGGVTESIKKELMINNIPFFPQKIALGNVIFQENNGDFANAKIVGFAASVNIYGSRCDIEYLDHISDRILEYCETNALHLVNIPLLGTGAGRLSAQKSFEVLKSHFENNKSITLRIFAYSKDVYSRLTNPEPNNIQTVLKNPRVFISYTGTDVENRKWVKALACRLRENGVNARIDIFHLKPGMDLPQFMTDEIVRADKVLLICDKAYIDKADSRNGGVGWETMLIQGDMMSHMESNKYICISRENAIDQGLPIYAKSKFSLHWPAPEISEENFEELLFHLFDCDIEPAIGEIPAAIKKKLLHL